MRIYLGFLLLIIFTQTHTMLRAKVRPVRIPRTPSRNVSGKVRSPHVEQQRQIDNMVSIIQRSSETESGRVHFINTLDKILDRQITRLERKKEEALKKCKVSRMLSTLENDNIAMLYKLSVHQLLLTKAIIKHLNGMQEEMCSKRVK